VTSSIRTGDFIRCVWNENNLKPLTSNYWRASLVPASAVIPAPRAYLKIVAVKKPVVEIRFTSGSFTQGNSLLCEPFCTKAVDVCRSFPVVAVPLESSLLGGVCDSLSRRHLVSSALTGRRCGNDHGSEAKFILHGTSFVRSSFDSL